MIWIFRPWRAVALAAVAWMLLLPALSTSARARSAVARAAGAGSTGWVGGSGRSSPTGLPQRLGVCDPVCGPEASLYTRSASTQLATVPSTWRGPPVDRTPLEGPFPSADDPKHLGALKGFLAALPMLALYGGVTTWAYFAWYHGQPPNRQLTVNDHLDEGFGPHTYAGGADKVGHFWANYLFARLGSQILIDRGWKPHWAVLLNVSFTVALYTLVEVRDGLHPGFGFSLEDWGANLLGAGVAALLLLVPPLDRLFGVRMLYLPSKLFRRALVHEGDIDGSEDYTGQTIMLAFHLGGIRALRRSRVFGFLRYVDLLVGYNTRGFLPKPASEVNREQEIFFGFSLNLVEILRDMYPNGQRMGWAAKGLADLTEYIQITPVHKTVGRVWRTPQPN